MTLTRPRSSTSSTPTGRGRSRERTGPSWRSNFAATVDGRATIGGVSGPIGSSADTAMLAGLRTRFDAVMIGAGTMRAERYGRPSPTRSSASAASVSASPTTR